jgi:sucrose-6-phosphate hydrolase SacC (GH32 family)
MALLCCAVLCSTVLCCAVLCCRRRWEKYSGNPVVHVAPPGGTTRQFRDPSGSFQLSVSATDDTTVTVVGGMVDGKGSAILYRLDPETMTHWEHLGSLYQLDPNSAAAGIDFECPDVFPIPGSSAGRTAPAAAAGAAAAAGGSATAAAPPLSLLKWGLGPIRTDFAVVGIIDSSATASASSADGQPSPPAQFRTRNLDKDNPNDVALATPRKAKGGMFKLDYGTFCETAVPSPAVHACQR